MTDEKEPDAAKIARDAAIEQAVGTLAYIAVALVVSALITKRDALTRLWMRLRHRPTSPEKAREGRLLADLRRDLTLIERDGGPAPRPRGLYER